MASIQKAVVSELIYMYTVSWWKTNYGCKNTHTPLIFVIFPVKIETAHVCFSDRLFSVCLSVCKHAFSRGCYKEVAKIHWRNLKNLLPIYRPISTKLDTKHPWVKGSNVFTIMDHIIFKKEIMVGFLLLNQSWYNHSFAQMCLVNGTRPQVSNVAHRPPVSL